MYGESWGSSCEKFWVPLQNHWVPVQKTRSPNLKMLGPLCDQVDKRYSFVKHNKVLKNYASFNNGQKNSHRNHTNRISYKKHLQIDQLIFVSYKGRCHYVCAFWWILMHQGCRTQRSQNHCINIFHYHHDHCFAGTWKISHEMCLIQPPI